MAKSAGILIKVAGDGAKFLEKASSLRALDNNDIEQVLSVPGDDPVLGISARSGSTWFRIGAKRQSSQNPWDEAHSILSPGRGRGLDGATVESIEPDWMQDWPTEAPGPTVIGMAAAADACAFGNQDGGSGRAKGDGNAWNFGDAFSQLSSARAKVGGKQATIVSPMSIRGLTLNIRPCRKTSNSPFSEISSEANGRMMQPMLTPANGGPLTNRGHGPATLSLLAGNQLGAGDLVAKRGASAASAARQPIQALPD